MELVLAGLQLSALFLAFYRCWFRTPCFLLALFVGAVSALSYNPWDSAQYQRIATVSDVVKVLVTIEAFCLVVRRTRWRTRAALALSGILGSAALSFSGIGISWRYGAFITLHACFLVTLSDFALTIALLAWKWGLRVDCWRLRHGLIVTAWLFPKPVGVIAYWLIQDESTWRTVNYTVEIALAGCLVAWLFLVPKNYQDDGKKENRYTQKRVSDRRVNYPRSYPSAPAF